MRFVPIAGCVMLAFIAAAVLAKSMGFPHVVIALLTCASVVIAALFYRMRGRTKLLYGVLELIIAAGFMYFLLLGMQEKPVEAKTIELITNRMLTLFAAAYFMVRAFDNIGQGLSGSNAEWWKKLFEGR